MDQTHRLAGKIFSSLQITTMFKETGRTSKKNQIKRTSEEM